MSLQRAALECNKCYLTNFMVERLIDIEHSNDQNVLYCFAGSETMDVRISAFIGHQKFWSMYDLADSHQMECQKSLEHSSDLRLLSASNPSASNSESSMMGAHVYNGDTLGHIRDCCVKCDKQSPRVYEILWALIEEQSGSSSFIDTYLGSSYNQNLRKHGKMILDYLLSEKDIKGLSFEKLQKLYSSDEIRDRFSPLEIRDRFSTSEIISTFGEEFAQKEFGIGFFSLDDLSFSKNYEQNPLS